MAKWLDLYDDVLMVRVLLSWFPIIPWDRQPLSAFRDLCDPYLNLFRNIIPPILNTLDVSPLLAFAVLGTLGSILNSTRQAYYEASMAAAMGTPFMHRFLLGRVFCKKGCDVDGDTWDECLGECDEICYKDLVLKDKKWSAFIDRSPGSASYSEFHSFIHLAF